jgi:cytochrome c553
MRLVLKILGGLILLVVVAAVGVYLWAGYATDRRLSATYETHVIDFPIPTPLSAEELAAAGVTEDSGGALALAQARERAGHLLRARYPCAECHGENFGGGTMIDAFPIGRLLGPNITRGRGSKTVGYTASDWDRAVRHGVLPDGRPSIMPAQDFMKMSDQELADIVAYIESLPPVDNEVPPPFFGPLGRVLVATGQLSPAVDAIPDQFMTHPVVPPVETTSVEYGAHIAATCMGCHGPELAGGPIVGGDPAWPPARNLTPHETGLAGWTYNQFVTALRDGRRPDGTAIREPMVLMVPMAQAMKDVELQAVWMYLQSLPPRPLPAS